MPAEKRWIRIFNSPTEFGLDGDPANIFLNNNKNGAFIDSHGYLQLSPLNNNILTIIHELGHWVNHVLGAGSSDIYDENIDNDPKRQSDINKTNNELIKKLCL